MTVTFSKPISLLLSDLTVTDSVGQTVDISAASLTESPDSTTVELDFGNVLPDGTYILVLRGDSVQDYDANLLDGDGDGKPGGDYTVPFTVAGQQVITLSPTNPMFAAGAPVSLDVNYTTSPLDPTLTGLGLRIHYNSSLLTLNNLTNVLPAGFIQQQAPVDDTADYDNDPTTDKYVLVSWADMTGNWPNVVSVRLFTANFTSAVAASDSTSTHVNVSASSTPSGWMLDPSSTTISFDSTAPSVTIGPPSATIMGGSGSVNYLVTYADPNFNASTLAASDITLNKTSTATGTVVVSQGTGLTRTVTISNISGDGTLGISLAAGTASDLAGNQAPAAGPSQTFVVDNTAPTGTIGAPSSTITATGPISYLVTYADANFNTSTLAASDITLNATGTATGTLGVSGTGLTRTVTISNISGNGTLGISLAAGTASDLAGNLAPAVGPSGTFVVDTQSPTASLSAISPVTSPGGTALTFTVVYSDDVAVQVSTLDSSDILVTGPNGYSQLATFDHATITTNGTPVIATYNITPPGSSWDAFDNGTYTVSMEASQVTDTASDAVAAGTLGTFSVNAEPVISGVVVVTAQGLMTWNVQDSDSLANSGLTVDGTAVSMVYGPYSAPSGVDFAGVLGTLSAGSHNYIITATDNLGNSSQYTGTFSTVANPIPTISMVAVSATQGVITWNAADAAGVTCSSLTIDGAVVTTVYGPYTVAPGLEYAGVYGGLLAGSHTYAITAADSAGNCSQSSGTFIVAGPTISMVAVSTTQGVITWNAADAAGVTCSSLTIDGAVVTTVYGPYTVAPGLEYAGVYGGLLAGSHTYAITAADSAGNCSQSSGTFIVAGPTISMVAVSTTQGVITWNAADAAGVTCSSLTIDGAVVTTVYGPYTVAPGLEYAGVYGGLLAGSHTYAITAADSAGNCSQSSGTFIVAGPTISMVAVSATQGVITWNAADAAGIACSSLTIDGAVVTTVYGPYTVAPGLKYAGVYGTLSAGTHNYTITATDNRGNSSQYTDTLSVAALSVDAAVPPQGSPVSLTDQQLSPIVAEAERRLASVGDIQVLTTMAGITIQVADLPGGLLGEAIGKTILIDRDAAGYGWFVDPTPADDSEFSNVLGPHELTARNGSPAAERVDLLTTVMHEMGHVLGYEHSDSLDLMYPTLPLGTRRSLGEESAFSLSMWESDVASNNGLTNTSALDQVFASFN